MSGLNDIFCDYRTEAESFSKKKKNPKEQGIKGSD